LVQFPPSSRRFGASLDKALYDDYLCLVASNKQKIKRKEVKNQRNGSEIHGQLLSGFGFVQNITPPSLSRYRSIKIEKNNYFGFRLCEAKSYFVVITSSVSSSSYIGLMCIGLAMKRNKSCMVLYTCDGI